MKHPKDCRCERCDEKKFSDKFGMDMTLRPFDVEANDRKIKALEKSIREKEGV
jgi:hypothetical protein